MILYFTATGNSRWIAELLAEAMHDTAVSIVDCLKQGYDTRQGAVDS